MGRNNITERRLRGSSGKYLGRPSKCENEPGKKACLEKLHGPNAGLCRNCQVLEVQTERIKVFGR